MEPPHVSLQRVCEGKLTERRKFSDAFLGSFARIREAAQAISRGDEVSCVVKSFVRSGEVSETNRQ